jgi:leucyl-tRNA synthetase
MVNSGPFTGFATIGKYSLDEWTPELAEQYGLPAHLTPETEGRVAVTRWLEKQGIGKFAVTYRLRDWLISRQRYWGAPIPMITCPACGIVPVPYGDLPVELPEDVQFMPTGESPLKFHEGFRHVKCPQCGGEAERETDTMDTFMCSSWYQYAYMDPHWQDGQPLSPDDMPFNPAEGSYWLPVDQYTGGIEHATMHLLYTRFFTKAMHDMGLVPFDEPMNALFNQGIILGEDREKMSKSRGNVVAPDDLVYAYGADTVRGYLMFGFRWDQGGPWDSKGILGVQRFLERVWELVTGDAGRRGGEETSEVQLRNLRRKQHQAIRRVTQDIEDFSFNTMVAGLMEYSNALNAIRAAAPGVVNQSAWGEAIRTLVLLLAPGFPHIAEELWAKLGQPYSVHRQSWPTWDEELAKEDTVEIAVQINGKVRDKIEVPTDIEEIEAKAKALAAEGTQRYMEGKTPAKVIYVPGRLVNIVVK